MVIQFMMVMRQHMTDGDDQNIKIDLQGRALTPKTIRDVLGIAGGDELIGRLEGGRLVLESKRSLLERL